MMIFDFFHNLPFEWFVIDETYHNKALIYLLYEQNIIMATLRLIDPC